MSLTVFWPEYQAAGGGINVAGAYYHLMNNLGANEMLILKQSTAVDVLIGPFVDKTDAATAEIGESPSVKLSKNGQASASKSDVTTPVHDADGYYNCELDATDTNTVGTLVLTVASSANALPVRHTYQVVEESVYDNIYAASAVGPLTAAQVNAECDTAISDAALATAANLAVVDGVVDTILVDTNELQTDWADGGRLDLIVDQILSDTGTDGVVISATTANEIADALLKRDWNSVSGEAARSALNALRFLRNKYSISGTTLTVTEEDDVTAAWTSTLTTNAAADPVTGSDPA